MDSIFYEHKKCNAYKKCAIKCVYIQSAPAIKSIIIL